MDDLPEPAQIAMLLISSVLCCGAAAKRTNYTVSAKILIITIIPNKLTII
jgi:hypothetical protein